DPDLQGTWTNTTTTPLERPKELAGKSVLTAEERAARDAAQARAQERPPARPPGHTRAYKPLSGGTGTASPPNPPTVDPPGWEAAFGTARATEAGGRPGSGPAAAAGLVDGCEHLRPVHYARPAGRDDARLL